MKSWFNNNWILKFVLLVLPNKMIMKAYILIDYIACWMFYIIRNNIEQYLERKTSRRHNANSSHKQRTTLS